MSSLEAGLLQPKATFPLEWLGSRLSPLSYSSRRHHSFLHQWTCSKQEEVLVVVGGGAAGVFGAIRAKSLCPSLNVFVLEQNQLLAKVKISGGGRCNVTTALYENPLLLAEQYPRGHKELRGSFFRSHGPMDTVSWFTERGVILKTEDDGRMFPASNTSSTIVDCLLTEAHKLGVGLQTKVSVSKVLQSSDSKFDVCTGGTKFSSSSIKADYLLLATGGTPKGFDLAKGLGHNVIDPRPSLFTFKVADSQLQELAGVSFPVVHAELQVKGQKHKNPRLTQAGPMLITHWGLSGPVVLRLSAWGARDLFSADYQGILWIDFEPKLSQEDLLGVLNAQRKYASKKKLGSFAPSDLSLVRRFWEYLLLKVEIDPDKVWATLNTTAARKLAALIKHCPFHINGKGEFKDEFVTSGGVPLVEVDLNSMESRICPCLYLAGEVLNVDGVTGGFNFQNAWTGGFIAGTSIGLRSNENSMH
ncbi:hypothetical protein GOP47_0016855 [Adiantum capillus-veneris]|uniref:Uncharacterized protein n=1 Tax=Adiantum capillus-veneris TaxID=13818 RepID=A0A9D4UII4_ADICA|nr:hypothetical protein GOP47_0016855 [Adiantum capillus-veneris]